jgi:hypothetical protein
VIELRNLGDTRTIVLYTNDNEVYRKVMESLKPLKVVPYEQEQKRGNVAMVGVDLYFPKECRRQLEKNIGIHTPEVKESLGKKVTK